MALKELYRAYIGESDFWKQVAGACMTAAITITLEDPGTPNHADRLQWAVNVRDNAKGMAKSMLVDVVKDATIAADVDNATDAQVQSVVDGLVNQYAG